MDGQITLPISPEWFWGIVTVAGIVLASLLVTVLLPKADDAAPRKGLRERLGLTDMPEFWFGIAAVLWGGLLLALFAGTVGTFWQTLFHLAPSDTENAQKVSEWRFNLLTLAAFTATLSAVVALPFTLLRTRFTSRQTATAEERILLDRENELTDRIYKAVEGLGSERSMTRMGRFVTATSKEHPQAAPSREVEWQDAPMQRDTEAFDYQDEPWTAMAETQPNIEVRIGAIYALERLARKNLDVHVQIMEILCAYIRENAPASKAAPGPDLILSPTQLSPTEQALLVEVGWAEKTGWTATRRSNLEHVTEWKSSLSSIRSDISVALEVLERRVPAQKATEIRGSRGDYDDWPFKEVAPKVDDEQEGAGEYRESVFAWFERLRDFDGYRIDLRNTDLSGADLSELDLRGWNLEGSNLQGTYMFKTKLSGARLVRANLKGALMFKANLQGSLMTGADLKGCTLNSTDLTGAFLDDADLRVADLTWAILDGVSLEDIKALGASTGWTSARWTIPNGLNLEEVVKGVSL